jgi:hypothetical protein
MLINLKEIVEVFTDNLFIIAKSAGFQKMHKQELRFD